MSTHPTSGPRSSSALKRHAEVEADAIRVTVQNGNKVLLEGQRGQLG